jgi:hypothetical protein
MINSSISNKVLVAYCVNSQTTPKDIQHAPNIHWSLHKWAQPKRQALRASKRFQGLRVKGFESNGRYWVRTSDLFRVKEARYHCANRPWIYEDSTLDHLLLNALASESRSQYENDSCSCRTFKAESVVFRA